MPGRRNDNRFFLLDSLLEHDGGPQTKVCSELSLPPERANSHRGRLHDNHLNVLCTKNVVPIIQFRSC